ncbi:hypothetical protein [Salinarchaeum laminariae]|uniref:hypothetical protein n=1 Tax=Salinarchaeum laminariae TaxID=869888 RepID=UPI0020BF3DEF|nr:hypothetical protein [Salinarchaeum laminariae]
MESISNRRLFGYALLAAIVVFVAWTVWPSLNGGLTLPAAIAAFSVLVFVDGFFVGRTANR